jgi:hypothetical protein
MSHFTCLIIHKDEENIKDVLQPYHEYESTGTEDEYVIDVDKTADVQEYLDREIYYGKRKEGGAWDYEYSIERAETQLNNHVKATRAQYFKAAGMTQEEIDEEIRDYHGYKKRGNQWIDHTNPNAKWDWWVMGGRWSGLLRVKKGAEAQRGENGIMGTNFDETGYDSCLIKDLDLEAMLRVQRERIVKGRHKAFDDALEKVKTKNIPCSDFMLQPDAFNKWDELSVQRKQCEDELRGVWESLGKPNTFRDYVNDEHAAGNPSAITVRLSEELGYSSMFGITPGQTMQQEIDDAQAICTFAVIKDGKWYERGEMGWWGCVSNEDDEWESKFNDLFKDADPDMRVTVVDCHI